MGICDSKIYKIGSEALYKNKNFNSLYSVKLMTIDQRVSESFIIRSDELFSVIINKFYEKYPEYINKNCTFLHNAQIMIPNFTMEQNNCESENTKIVVAFD